MKLESATQTSAKNTKTKNARSQIEARLEAKFGKKFKKDAVSLSKKSQNKAQKMKDTKDENIKGGFEMSSLTQKSDPNSDVTRQKLRTILRQGAFEFDTKERKALAQILDV